MLHKLDAKLLKTLLSDKLNGAVVLCHDDSASYWRSMLDYTLIYGIREAKGLVRHVYKSSVSFFICLASD